jgi:hypothetical protein
MNAPPDMPETPGQPEPTPVTALLARLVRDMPLASGAAAADGATIYRPLIVGPAVLRGPAAPGEAWLVSLEPGESVRPRCPRSRAALRAHVRALRATGMVCRVAGALVAPEDVRTESDAEAESGTPVRRAGVIRSEFYGWSLLYQPAGSPRTGLVEPHPSFPGLPAFFRSPDELLERTESLARRGVRARPLVLFTQPEDFDEGPDGTWINRYAAAGSFRLANRLHWLG